MITAVVGIVILALTIAVVVVIAKDRGPGPGEVAVAYELAWDRLDFESLFTLSGLELRDGLDRRGFIAAKRTAYEGAARARRAGRARGRRPGGEQSRRRGRDHRAWSCTTAPSCTTGSRWPGATGGGRSSRTGSSRRPRTHPAPTAEPASLDAVTRAG